MKENALGAETMGTIRKHIDRLCMRMNESPAEVEDFREEMTSNLVSGVKEWMSRGYKESDALQKALELFGEPSHIESELSKLYRIKKVFAGTILKASIVLLILGTFITGWVPVWNEGLQSVVAMQAFQIVRQELGAAEEPVSAEMKQKLEQKVASSISITGATLRIHDKGIITPNDPVVYRYPDDLKLDRLNNIPFEKHVFSYVATGGTSFPIPGTEKEMSIQVGMTLFTNTTFMLGITLLFGYWVLYAVWVSMNVYYRGHGKAIWVVMFLLFNALGYGFYISTIKMSAIKQQQFIRKCV